MIGIGWLTSWLLAILVPDRAREPFVGDLLEETTNFVAPALGRRRATIWFWGQVLRSVPAFVVAHDRTTPGRGARRVVVTAAGLVALAQAWDSGVFEARTVVLALTAAAIALVFGAGLGGLWPRLYAAAIVGAGLLPLAARLTSPVRLPDLFVGLTPFAPSGSGPGGHRTAPTA